jgi:hypothetical protein
MSEKIRIEQHSFAGGLWIIGWLFTVGFLKLTFGKVHWHLSFGRMISGWHLVLWLVKC